MIHDDAERTDRLDVVATTDEYPVVSAIPSNHRPVANQTRHRGRRASPVALRTLAAVAWLTASLLAVVVLLADRAPAYIEDRLGVDPEADLVAHVGLWGLLVLFAGIAAWSAWGLVVVVVGAAAASLALEVAQDRYSATRSFEARDVVANLAGVAAGAVMAAAVIGLWSLVGRGRRRRYR